MEIHPPDHPVMTWKQFFVHMAVVVLGLLIAIGLEQTVEGLHHRRERAELRDAMARDLEIIHRDSALTYAGVVANAATMRSCIVQAQTALETHHPLASGVDITRLGGNIVADPSFRAAQGSGTLLLLSQEDIRAFSELDAMITDNRQHALLVLDAIGEINSFNVRFGSPANPQSRWASASPEDLRSYIAALSRVASLDRTMASLNGAIHGASEAILHGERDMQKIDAAELAPVASAR